MQRCIVIFFLLSSYFLKAQEFFWEDHLPYNNVIKLAQSSSKIYCATSYAIFIYDKQEKTVNKLSKAQGLSDIGISTIAFNSTTSQLFIGYTNGSIDVLENNTITNYPFIKEKNILASKAINNIIFKNSEAIIATGYGISIFDITKKELKSSYYIGKNNTFLKVNDIVLLNNLIYTATDSGLFYADTTKDLSDYNNWQADTGLFKGKFNLIEEWNGNLWANYSSNIYNGDTCYIMNQSGWMKAPASVFRNSYSLEKGITEMVFSHNGAIQTMRENGSYKQQFLGEEPRFAIQDQSDSTIFWAATTYSGLIKIRNLLIEEFIIPDGPTTNRTWEFDVKNGEIACIPGAFNSALNNIYNIDGLSIFKENNWETYNGADDKGFDTLFDLVDIKYDKNNSGSIFLASWGLGLAEFNNGKIINVFNDQNSTIQSRSAFKWFGIGGIAFDKTGNLWCTNSFVSSSHLNRKDKNGNWHSFNLSPFINDGFGIGKVIIDDAENKWLLLSKYGKIVVFNENGTITNSSDDSLREITSLINEGSLPGSFPGTLVFDKNGTAWVGTNDGIAYLKNAKDIFQYDDVNFRRVFVDGDSTLGSFLKGENISDIEVTNVNQKWVGTIGKGIYLMNENMDKVIFHFTKENSPLFSNDILALKYEGKSGKLFISTSYGVMSLKITEEKIFQNFNEILIYPNPVNISTENNLTIDNLPKGTIINITDVSGNMVNKLIAESSSVMWDLTDFSGAKVTSNIYLLYFLNSNGTDKTIQKILLTN